MLQKLKTATIRRSTSHDIPSSPDRNLPLFRSAFELRRPAQPLPQVSSSTGKFIGADPYQHHSMTQRQSLHSGHVIPMKFCPNCGMLLKYELSLMSLPVRFFCPTCPYVSQIESKVKIKRKQRSVKKVVDSIIMINDMSNEPKTDQGGPSRVVKSKVQGDVYTGGGDDVEIHPERNLFGSDTDLDPLVVPGMSSSSKRRKLVKEGSNIVAGKSSNEVGQTHAYEKHAPEVDLHFLKQVRCLAQLVGSVPVTSWFERKAKREARLRDRVSRYRVRLTVRAAENAKLAKRVRKFKMLQLQESVLDKEKEAVRMVATNTMEHANAIEALKKELHDARVASEEKLKQTTEEIKLKRKMVEKLNGEIELEKDARTQESVWFEKSLERVTSERRWLIEEGFGYAINRLHRSREYLELLATVQSKLWESGAYYGLVEGYASCKDGVALENVSLYNPEAHGKFLKAVHELEHTRFPYVVALSRCTDRPLDDLKALEPTVMDEDVNEVAGGGDQ